MMAKSVAKSNERDSNHIPNDLVFSILSNLSLKSLKRFQCMCKSYGLLFENPYFMSMYRMNFISNSPSGYDDTSSLLLLQCAQQSELHLLSSKTFEKKVKINWPPPIQEGDAYINILNSVSINGIFCVCGYYSAVLWNPAVEKFRVIPPSPAIRFIPEFLVFFRGFGYDRVRDDYKVFHCSRILKSKSTTPCKILWEIYSLKRKKWRKLKVDMPCHRCWTLHTSVLVCLNGACHWWVRCEMHSDKECLASFDFSKEMLVTTRIRSDMDGSFDFKFVERHLVALNGYTALFSNNIKTTIFHISILGEVGVEASWVKLFTIGPLPYIARPMGVGKKSDIFFRKKDDELVKFDLSTRKMEELGFKGKKIVVYEEDLLSIGRINN